MTDAATSDDPATAEFAAAADRVRETAKWLIVAFAAVGAVLVAGAQLSSIGKLDVSSARFAICVVGLALAVIGVVVAIFVVSGVLVVRTMTLEFVRRSIAPIGTRRLRADLAMLGGFESVERLARAYETGLTRKRTTAEAYLRKPWDKRLRAIAEGADTQQGVLAASVTNLLKVAHYQHLNGRWLVARVLIAVAGIVIVAGIALFSWGANPPADVTASVAYPLVLTSPANAMVSLTAVGRDALAASAGQTCVATTDRPVLVLGQTAAGPDVLFPKSKDCVATRFVLVSSWGVLDKQ